MTESIVVGDLMFLLHRSSKRKTIGITVERNGELVLAVPSNFPVDQVEGIAQEKLFWIYRKLAEKEMLQKPVKPKEYVSGEGFYYLGKSYRLLITDSNSEDADIPALNLNRGRFMLRRDELDRAQGHFIEWYVKHGRHWLAGKIDQISDRICARPKSIEIRDLGFRWGSCSCDGRINFHWRTILLPPTIIEYLIVHELVHLHEGHHTDDFWRRIERAMPDYASRRIWLAENGASYAL